MSKYFHQAGPQMSLQFDFKGNLQAGEWKMAFNTCDGALGITPLELRKAPALFQKFVNNTFQNLLHVCVSVYLDDILVFSSDLSTHRRHVCIVLQHLQENQIYANVFEKACLPFLGQVISDQDLQMDQDKLSAVLKWPCPQGLEAIQCFLGFSNYYLNFCFD